jgi:hypothetical protein
VAISMIVAMSTCRCDTSCPRQFRYAWTSGCAAAAGNDECGERQGRLVLVQQTLRVGHVDFQQAMHRRRSLAGPQCGTNQASILRKGSHLDFTRAIADHGLTFPRTGFDIASSRLRKLGARGAAGSIDYFSPTQQR